MIKGRVITPEEQTENIGKLWEFMDAQILKANHITRNELASMSGLSENTLRRIENKAGGVACGAFEKILLTLGWSVDSDKAKEFYSLCYNATPTDVSRKAFEHCWENIKAGIWKSKIETHEVSPKKTNVKAFVKGSTATPASKADQRKAFGQYFAYLLVMHSQTVNGIAEWIGEDPEDLLNVLRGNAAPYSVFTLDRIATHIGCLSTESEKLMELSNAARADEEEVSLPGYVNKYLNANPDIALVIAKAAEANLPRESYDTLVLEANSALRKRDAVA